MPDPDRIDRLAESQAALRAKLDEVSDSLRAHRLETRDDMRRTHDKIDDRERRYQNDTDKRLQQIEDRRAAGEAATSRMHLAVYVAGGTLLGALLVLLVQAAFGL